MRESWERVERPGTYVADTPPSLLGTVFFRTALPSSDGYHLERDRDAVT